LTLSNGAFVTFMPIYWMPLPIGVDATLTLPACLQLGEVLVRQVEGDVGVAALDQRAAVAGRRHHAAR
jgi:hypothetical protein